MNQRSYEAVCQAVGVDLLPFADPVEAVQGMTPDELRLLYPIQSDIYTRALGAVASVVHRNRADRDRTDLMPDEHQFALLHTEFGPERDRMKLVSGILHFIDREDANPSPYLRHQQRSIFGSLSQFMQSRSKDPEHPLAKRGHIKTPTGTGKTVVQAKLIEAAGTGEQRPPKTLVLEPSRALVTQTIGSRSRRGRPTGFALHAPKLNVTQLGGKKSDTTGDVVVGTYAAFNAALERGDIQREDFGLLIADEGHRAIGPKTKKNLQDFTADMPAIALSATMDFGLDHHVGELFEEEIYSLDLREAVERSFLAPVKVMLYKTDLELESIKGADFSQEDLDKVIDNEARNAAAVDFAKSFVADGKSGLIACAPGNNTRHAFMMAERINAETITDASGKTRQMRAVALHGGIKEAEREKIFEEFEAGLIDVLTYVDLINEGWDSDRAKFLINLRPTSSPVLAEQRLGRILRGDELAIVVDFVDTTKRAQYLALHALGEYRYILGNVYGNSQGSEIKRIRLPEKLLPQLEILSGKRLNELVASSDHEARYYPDRPIHELALELEIDPAVLAIIAKELGVVHAQAGGSLVGRSKSSDLGLVVNEVNVSRILQSLHTDKFSMLLNRDPQSLRQIVSVVFSGSSEALLLKGLAQERVRYDTKKRLVEQAENLQSGALRTRKKLLANKLNVTEFLELVAVSAYVRPTNPYRQEFLSLLNLVVIGLASPQLDLLQNVLLGQRRISDISIEVEELSSKRRKHSGWVAHAKTMIADREVTVSAVDQKSVTARLKARRALLSQALYNGQVSVGVADREIPEDEAAQVPKDTLITDKHLINYFSHTRRLNIIETDKAEKEINGVVERVVAWTIRINRPGAEPTVVKVTGRGSSNSLATSHVQSQVVDHCVEIFGMPATELVISDIQKHTKLAGNSPTAAKLEIPGSTDYSPQRSLEINAQTPYVRSPDIVNYTGGVEPEEFIKELCQQLGLKPPRVHYETKGTVIIAKLSLDDGTGIRTKFSTGFSLDQRIAVQKAYAGLVKMLVTFRRQPEKYNKQKNYMQLQSAGLL